MEPIILLLSVLVIIHTLFGIGSILCMLSFFFDKNIPGADLLAFLSVLSFLFLKKCVYIDIYEYCKGNREDLPEYCKDSFIRNKIHRVEDPVDYTPLRLDKVNNLEPLKNCETIELFFNRKIQYIVFNVILTMILSIKYDKKKFLPLLLIWILTTFPS